MDRADSQISGSASVGPALKALCLHMEVGKYLQREPGPPGPLRQFLTLNPNGMSSEILKYCRQGCFGFFCPHFQFLAAARGGSTKVSRVSLLSLALSCKLRKFEDV